MSNFDRLYAELVCCANGAELKDYKENLAVNETGELIKEVHVVALVHPLFSEIEITIGKEFECN